MMKLSNFLRSRSAVSEQLLPGKSNSSWSALWTHNITSLAGDKPTNIFADYTIYKTKAALSLAPILPKFTKAGSGGLAVDKKGAVILTFSPAIGERKYDWQKKQVFALSATEVGSLISLAPGKSCEFFHDPSMKTSNAGQVRKSFSVKPHDDDSGCFFTLSVVNGIQKTNDRITISLTKAEFTVIRTACSYILPQILGWDQYATSNQLPRRSTYPVVQPQMRVNMKDEWDR